MFTIALVEDHVFVRRAFKHFISEICNCRVIAEASNGKELLDSFDSIQLNPDIVLTDVQMPVMDGKKLARELTVHYPQIKTIAISALCNEYNMIDMFRAGARGFISKHTEQEQFTLAVATVMNNDYYFSDAAGNILSTDYLKQAAGMKTSLTEKELYFVKLSLSDLPYKSIADEMHISTRTVDAHRDNVFKKLNIRNRTGLFLYALKKGLIDTW
ncbi:MAG TPA: response regulator transcription factor [Chitinophagaceae bacterium]|nr:response regulator transcription factor [Chitinophagaceae bacterium]